MRILTTILLLILCSCQPQQPPSTSVANCGVTGAPTPLIDMTNTATYNDSLGRLYDSTAVGFSTNLRPADYDSVGKRRALEVAPRDANGNINWANGKIGVVHIGHSNNVRLANWIIYESDTLNTGDLGELTSPFLTWLNASVGGNGGGRLEFLVDTLHAVWTDSIPDSLSSISNEQVQVIMLQSNIQPNVTTNAFAESADSTRGFTLRLGRIFQAKFPNLKQVFIIGTVCNQYADEGNREPDYFNSEYGFRFAVDRMINREDSVDYVKSVDGFGNWSGEAPWMDWLIDLRDVPDKGGGYVWTNENARSFDSWVWDCPDHYESDGFHLSNPLGRREMFLQLLPVLLDSDLTVWFRKSGLVKNQL